MQGAADVAPPRCSAARGALPRWWWAGGELMEAYHDREWGVPLHDDRGHFELLSLEGAQAGLSWRTILARRDGYRRVFRSFEPEAVAAMGDDELSAALADPGIVRNRSKVASVAGN